MNISIRCNRWLVAALCVIALAWTSRLVGQELSAAKPEDVGVSSEKLAKITEFSQKLIDDGKMVGAVTCVARRGKVVHFEAVGMADREEKKPMTTDTIFRIASMTKPVATVATLMLYDEGKVGLDDPVSKYIPEFANPTVLVKLNPLHTKPAEREITIRDLLTHTSGLTYSTNDTVGHLYREAKLAEGLCQEDQILSDNMKKLGGIPLLFSPGERWEYGMSMEVLGRVVEVVSGMSFDEFLRKRMFVPLKMTDTCFFLPDEKIPRLAAAYQLSDAGEIERIPEGEACDYHGMRYSADYPYRGPRKYFSGTAGLCSTAADYLRFCQMLLNNGELDGVRILKPETVTMMTTNQIGELTGQFEHKFGMGVMVVEEVKNGQSEQLRASYGWGGFFTTSFCVAPRSQWILVTMSQVVWNEEFAAWLANYQQLAAEAIDK